MVSDTMHTFLMSGTNQVGTPHNIERKHILRGGDTAHTLLGWGHRTTFTKKAQLWVGGWSKPENNPSQRRTGDKQTKKLAQLKKLCNEKLKKIIQWSHLWIIFNGEMQIWIKYFLTSIMLLFATVMAILRYLRAVSTINMIYS